jgi:hypothetical protein
MGSSNRTLGVHNGNAIHYAFGEGEAVGMVQSYYVPTMSHVWPSGSNGEVLEATDVLMNFFSEWSIEQREKAAVTLPEASAGSHLIPVSQSLVLACITTLFVVGYV